MGLPADPAEFLALDSEQQADLLLAALADCEENECGRNFLIFQLQKWFPESVYGLGATMATANPSIRRGDAEDVLDEVYAYLETQGLIRANPRAGSTFCKLTTAGRARVGAAGQPDAARIAFAHKAMDGITLHSALESRQVGAHFRQGKFETALRDGSVFIEDSIRTLSGVGPRLVGVKLASKAFSTTGKLADPGLEGAEQAALQNLYMGFFGLVRNQVAHNDFRYDSNKEAFQALMLLDYLVERLDVAAKRLSATLV